MKISRDEARRVAELAALEFGDEALDQIAGEMSRILDYVDQLEAVRVKPDPEDGDRLPSPTRADDAREADLGDAVGSNAPSMQHSLFVVPKVIGGD
jgi:aspartyl-tRNA(Asn)/glutamyl-tRNA(Gln) amidotransferase subunit C